MGFPVHPNESEIKVTISIIKEQIEYLKLSEKYKLDDILKHTVKCLANCINSIIDRKCVMFVDVSFNDPSIKKWYPFLTTLHGNLSTLQALEYQKEFYRTSQR